MRQSETCRTEGESRDERAEKKKPAIGRNRLSTRLITEFLHCRKVFHFSFGFGSILSFVLCRGDEGRTPHIAPVVIIHD